ncbi:glycerol-3-phosphate acyltransferase [Bacillus massilinigeriensis]|uniref:glycerol-3-phosphate acyltransferase n=1 Tax=Bacillus massilionigeriensis TaxID=1805475 RepID=UPI0036F19BB5
MWPFYLQFRGGKGVVVFLAVTLYILPLGIPITGVIVGIGYMLVRQFTIPGLIALSSIPITSWFSGKSSIVTTYFILMLIIVLISHIKGTNLKRGVV